MSIGESVIAPYLTLLVIFVILAGFFRKTLIKVIATIAVLVVLFAIFPQLLSKFIDLVALARGIFS